MRVEIPIFTLVAQTSFAMLPREMKNPREVRRSCRVSIRILPASQNLKRDRAVGRGRSPDVEVREYLGKAGSTGSYVAPSSTPLRFVILRLVCENMVVVRSVRAQFKIPLV